MILTGLTRERPRAFRLNYESPLARGLVFAGLGAFAGGLSCNDSSIYRNHGTLTNMDPATDWVWSPILGRWALDFDGSNDYIPTPFSAPSFPWSVSFFASFTTISSVYVVASFGDDIVVNVSSTDFRMQLNDNSGNACKLTTTRSSGTLNHYAITCSGVAANATKIYLDGVRGDNAGAVNFQLAGTLDIARQNTPAMRYLSGLVSDFTVYRDVISESAISALADPGNVLLRCGGVDLIQGVRTLWPGFAAGRPAGQFTQLSALGVSGAVRAFAAKTSSGNRRRRVLIAGVAR
jgi:hypothetical protein